MRMVLAIRRLALVAVVLLGASLGAGSVNAESPAGRYVGQIEGQRVELLLEPDGRASLLGQHGTWTSSQGGVILSSDGESVQATINAGLMVFFVEGVRFALQKQSAQRQSPQSTSPKQTAVPAPEANGRGFSPRQLPGKRISIAGVDASFVVPKGWKAVHGKEAIALTNTKFPGVVFAITASMLSGQEASATVPQLLKLAAQDVLGDTPVRVVRGPEEFRIDGKSAGQLVLEGSDGVRTIRGRFGGIKVERWGIGFVAFYETKLDAAMTPVFETVLASFRGKAPKANRALASKLAGCWQRYSGESSVTGSSSISSTYRFDAHGRYAYSYFMSASVPGGSGISDSSKASGTFAVYGSELLLENDQGESSSYDLRFERGRLHIGSGRYIPCS